MIKLGDKFSSKIKEISIFRNKKSMKLKITHFGSVFFPKCLINQNNLGIIFLSKREFIIFCNWAWSSDLLLDEINCQDRLQRSESLGLSRNHQIIIKASKSCHVIIWRESITKSRLSNCESMFHILEWLFKS